MCLHIRKAGEAAMTAQEKRATEENGIAAVYERQYMTVYRVCFSFLRNEADASDMMQETFMRYMTCAEVPAPGRHETAWLVMTAGNLCRNFLRDHRNRISPDELDISSLADESGGEDAEVLAAVMSLPEKYKTAVYLYYYEGMDTQTISEYTGERHSTVRSRLKRARDILRKTLGGDPNG